MDVRALEAWVGIEPGKQAVNIFFPASHDGKLAGAGRKLWVPGLQKAEADVEVEVESPSLASSFHHGP